MMKIANLATRAASSIEAWIKDNHLKRREDYPTMTTTATALTAHRRRRTNCCTTIPYRQSMEIITKKMKLQSIAIVCSSNVLIYLCLLALP
eukprot:649946-Ditylum_brightwellii.AAC.1